ncbi:MAG: aminotransferase [Vicingaceae bacterium]|nr:MAG: aminotransferase [Vicingaceae bacterium]
MKVPFSPPKINDDVINAVVETLRSGWITTGPKTKQFEKELAEYCGCRKVLCLNSATAGLELVLRWWGVGPGDEVILPAYTYSATANVVLHCGAIPVLVDTKDDFNIDIEAVKKAINPHTKVIMPVDIAGFPCDYDELLDLVNQQEIKSLFKPSNERQEILGRILILSDSAHSFGAYYKGKRSGSLADFSVFSFHAVKNLTTAEGGAVCIQMPQSFDADEIYKSLSIKSLHGQTKDALAKMQIGNWRYDIVEPGFKCNMTDIQAAMGLAELPKYDKETLPKRKYIFEKYTERLKNYSWAQIPVYKTDDKESSYHLYPLRIKGINEQQRDKIMDVVFSHDVAVNVHFQPLPLLSAYKSRGYKMEDYPVAYDNYSREISLPVYYDLSDQQIGWVLDALIDGVNRVLGA